MSSNTFRASYRVIPVCPSRFRNSLLTAVSVGQPTFQGHYALAAPFSWPNGKLPSEGYEYFLRTSTILPKQVRGLCNTKVAQCLTSAQTTFGHWGMGVDYKGQYMRRCLGMNPRIARLASDP